MPGPSHVCGRPATAAVLLCAMRDFPPTILNTGTRDLLLSNTVRVHRKLRQAAVIADLHVHEGQAHGGWREHTPYRARFQREPQHHCASAMIAN